MHIYERVFERVAGTLARWAMVLLVAAGPVVVAGAPEGSTAPASPSLADLIEQKRAIISAFATQVPRNDFVKVPLPPPKGGRGLPPGERAERFELQSIEGGSRRLGHRHEEWPSIVGPDEPRFDDAKRGADAVGLLRLEGKLHCTATVVGRRLLLTAGHCVAGTDAQDLHDPSRLTFAIGVDGEGEQIAIAKLIPHPAYRMRRVPRFSLTNDLAVIVLAADALARPLRIPDGDITTRLLSEKLLFVGYGFNGWNGDWLGGGTRMAVALSVRPEPGAFRYGSRGKSTCVGDSGGPALLEGIPQTSGQIVAGVTSFVTDAACDADGVDVRTDAHLDWLHQQGL
jgi:hypothetical protein